METASYTSANIPNARIILKKHRTILTSIRRWITPSYNGNRRKGVGDGAVITPSHNPPMDDGFKYNPPSAGPADDTITRAVAARANDILESVYGDVKRMAFEQALKTPNVHHYDYVQPYVDDLAGVIDMQGLISLKDKFDIAFGNDPDADRQ